jgi:hypothetical protein
MTRSEMIYQAKKELGIEDHYVDIEDYGEYLSIYDIEDQQEYLVSLPDDQIIIVGEYLGEEEKINKGEYYESVA